MKFQNLRLGLCLLAATSVVFAARTAEFPAVYNSEQDQTAAPPLPQESLAKLKLPPGFTATVFAAEPDVRNPIAMAWDARGRLWIAENYTYAERPKRFDLQLRDRILIFEDSDGDGRFDSRKVFSEEAQRLTSIEIGRGGVWAMCPPQLVFIPNRDGDDLPDGPAEVVLDGFKVPPENYHNLANGLRWGPDRLRPLLCREQKPPPRAQPDPLLQTTEHLRALFTRAECPPAEFQLHFQHPFLG